MLNNVMVQSSRSLFPHCKLDVTGGAVNGKCYIRHPFPIQCLWLKELDFFLRIKLTSLCSKMLNITHELEHAYSLFSRVVGRETGRLTLEYV